MSQNNWGWQGPQEVSSLIPSRNSDQVLSTLVLKTSKDQTAQPLWTTCCTAWMSQPLLLQLMPVATCPPSPPWGAWLSVSWWPLICTGGAVRCPESIPPPGWTSPVAPACPHRGSAPALTTLEVLHELPPICPCPSWIVWPQTGYSTLDVVQQLPNNSSFPSINQPNFC